MTPENDYAPGPGETEFEIQSRRNAIPQPQYLKPETSALLEFKRNHTKLWEFSQNLQRERDKARKKCDDLEAMIERMKNHAASKPD